MKKRTITFSGKTIDECREEANAWSITKALKGIPAKNKKIKEHKSKKGKCYITITYTD